MELEDLPFKVVLDRGSDSEVLGRAANLFLARALFNCAVALNPRQQIVQCNKSHVVERHPKVIPHA